MFVGKKLYCLSKKGESFGTFGVQEMIYNGSDLLWLGPSVARTFCVLTYCGSDLLQLVPPVSVPPVSGSTVARTYYGSDLM